MQNANQTIQIQYKTIKFYEDWGDLLLGICPIVYHKHLVPAFEDRREMTDYTLSSDFHNNYVRQLLVVGSRCRPEAIVC